MSSECGYSFHAECKPTCTIYLEAEAQVMNAISVHAAILRDDRGLDQSHGHGIEAETLRSLVRSPELTPQIIMVVIDNKSQSCAVMKIRFKKHQQELKKCGSNDMIIDLGYNMPVILLL